jgi:hypothetical protein
MGLPAPHLYENCNAGPVRLGGLVRKALEALKDVRRFDVCRGCPVLWYAEHVPLPCGRKVFDDVSASDRSLQLPRVAGRDDAPYCGWVGLRHARPVDAPSDCPAQGLSPIGFAFLANRQCSWLAIYSISR